MAKCKCGRPIGWYKNFVTVPRCAVCYFKGDNDEVRN
jgi:hypothetical protein